jgi:hypothetical protein
MKTIINFIISLFTSRTTINPTEYSTPAMRSVLQNILYSRIIRTFHDSSICPQLEKPVSSKVLEEYIKNHFVMLCHNRILDSVLIDEFSLFFTSINVSANSTMFNGYLLVDGHNVGCAYENTVAVAVQHGELIGTGYSQLFGFHHADVKAEYKSYAECWDKSSLALFGESKGHVWDKSTAFAWDKTHISGHDDATIVALGNSTYTLEGNSQAFNHLRTDDDESIEIWELD